jgi:hypothetical protein
MSNAIFSTISDSFIVNHILHAGPVLEIVPQNRKNENTHYFKVTTSHGVAFCHFKDEENARKSRGRLGILLGEIKPHLFRSKGDTLDITSIVSFGRTVTLKSENNEDIFGVPVTLATASEKSASVWLIYQTEETANNVRKALWAALMSYYNPAEKSPAPLTEADELGEAQVEMATSETQ